MELTDFPRWTVPNQSHTRLGVWNRRLVRATILLVVAGTPAGCVRWKPVTLVENANGAAQPHFMIVTMKSGQVIELERPVVRQDSLFGKNRNGGRSVAVALSDVASARARDVNGGITFLAIAGTFLAVAILVFFATFSIGY